MRPIHVALLVIMSLVPIARSAETLTHYPTWGIAFTHPADPWKSQTISQPSHVAQWFVPATDQQRPASISVTASTIKNTLDEQVAMWMKQTGVQSREFMLDGERAVELTGMQSQHGAPPHEVIVFVQRDSMRYSISGFASKDHSTQADVAAICASWKWMEREPLSKHLELEPPVSILEGKIQAALPPFAYQFVGANDKRKVLVGLTDVATNIPAYTIEFETQTKDATLTGEALGKACVASLWWEFKPEGKQEWKTLSGPLVRTISAPFTVELVQDWEDEEERPVEKRVMMLGVVELDDRRHIQVIATLRSPDAEDHPLLAAMTENIVESIVAAPPPPPAPLEIGAVTGFPAWGVALATPTGAWERPLDQGASRMATWFSGGTPEHPGRARISIYANTLNPGGTLETAAAEWQKNFHGDLREFTVAGDRAVELTNLAVLKGNHMDIVVLVVHGNVLYTMVGASDAGRSTKAEIAAMAESCRWIEREPVASHLDLREQPVTALGGQIRLAVPVAAFQASAANDQAKFKIGLQNVVTNRTDYTFNVEFIAKDPQVDVATLARRCADDVKKQFDPDPMPIMMEREGSTPRLLTQPFFVSIPERKTADGKIVPATRHVIMQGVVGFDPNKALLITAALTSPTTHDNAAFADLTQKMIESITIVQKK